jgi:hypothetical protein
MCPPKTSEDGEDGWDGMGWDGKVILRDNSGKEMQTRIGHLSGKKK